MRKANLPSGPPKACMMDVSHAFRRTSLRVRQPPYSRERDQHHWRQPLRPGMRAARSRENLFGAAADGSDRCNHRSTGSSRETLGLVARP